MKRLLYTLAVGFVLITGLATTSLADGGGSPYCDPSTGACKMRRIGRLYRRE